MAEETNDTQRSEVQETTHDRDGESRAKARVTGFALMDPERRKAIASAGGKAAHARGTAHRFDSSTASAAGRRAHERGTAHVWTPEAAREAGRKGGRAARKNRTTPTTTSPAPASASTPSTAE
jgi:general stress protein YciG